MNIGYPLSGSTLWPAIFWPALLLCVFIMTLEYRNCFSGRSKKTNIGLLIKFKFCRSIIIIIITITIRWHYSLMRTLASLMAFSQSPLFFDLFPICNFAFINICLWPILSTILLGTGTYILSSYSHRINPFPPPRSIPLSLTLPSIQFRFLNNSFPSLAVTICRTVAQLSTWRTSQPYL